MITAAEITQWLLSAGVASALVFARALGLVWTAPAFSSPGLDLRIRFVVAVLLSMVVTPAVESAIAVPTTASAVAFTCVIELAIGAALGFAAALVIAGAQQAGEIVGVQAGLSPASIFNAEASDEMTAMGHFYGLFALAAFLALDGPLALVGSLVESFRALPVGGVSLGPEVVDQAFARVGWSLGLAIRAAAPVALALLIAGVALGLLGRAAPSLQLMSLALPVRAAVGLVLVAIGLIALAATMTAAWGLIL